MQFYLSYLMMSRTSLPVATSDNQLIVPNKTIIVRKFNVLFHLSNTDVVPWSWSDVKVTGTIVLIASLSYANLKQVRSNRPIKYARKVRLELPSHLK